MSFSLDLQVPYTTLREISCLLPSDRHSANSLPATDESLREWLNEVWAEKDQLLKTTFLQGHFPGPRAAFPDLPVNASYVALLFWTPLTLGNLVIDFL